MKLYAYVLSLMVFYLGPFASASQWDRVFSDKGYKGHPIEIFSTDVGNFGGRKFTPPLFEANIKNPKGLPSLAQITRNMMIDKKEDLSTLIVYTLARSGFGVRRDLVGDPVLSSRRTSEKNHPLKKSIEKIFLSKGQKAPAGLGAKISKVPLEVQKIASFLIEVSLQSVRWHFKAFKNKKGSSKKVEDILMNHTNYEAGIGGAIEPELMELAESVDVQFLASGSVDLAVAVEEVRSRLGEIKNDKIFAFEVKTPLGKIILNGGSTNNTIRGPVLLALDLGGDDTYISATGSSVSRPVNLVIDVSGNDFYLAKKDMQKQTMNIYSDRQDIKILPDVGSGFFGYSFLLDLKGNDTYRARSFAIGSGVFGVGVVWDLEGNDVYDCYSFCQASSFFGGGFLIDGQGSDKYSGFRSVQAFASTRGSSLLLDTGDDNDFYKAYTLPLDFPSSIDPKINASFAQGTSLGKRSDIIDGHSWSGGVAVLIDNGGANHFEAGFFAQGFAYWYGLAMLLTSEGKDTYLSGKYSQGSATHFGIGILYDKGGDDFYRVSQELGLGVGHDFSYGVFVDLKGNDKYEAANLSLGCGSANGMGFFWDNEGNDSYKLNAKEFMGCAIDRVSRHSIRNRNKTIGIFVDAEGKDTIESPVKELNGSIGTKTWRHKAGVVTPKFSSEFFLGVGFFYSKSFEDFPDGVNIIGSQVF